MNIQAVIHSNSHNNRGVTRVLHIANDYDPQDMFRVRTRCNRLMEYPGVELLDYVSDSQLREALTTPMMLGEIPSMKTCERCGTEDEFLEVVKASRKLLAEFYRIMIQYDELKIQADTLGIALTD